MRLVHQLSSLASPQISTTYISTQRPCIGNQISLPTFRNKNTYCPVQCIASPKVMSDEKIVARREANYQPPFWPADYMQSLKSEYSGDRYAGLIEGLKQEVRVMLRQLEGDHLAHLEHIDVLQRLGLSYHFENEIKSALKGIQSNENSMWKRNNLHATALEFRLLRQHGFSVPPDVFSAFKDYETGEFRASLSEDTLGMLSLYEASFHLVEGENILEEARDFSTRALEEYLKYKDRSDENNDLDVLVPHALELPLHWRMLRFEARWFIDVYERREHKNNRLLELAILDFNIVQSTYHDDLKDAARWWKSTGLRQNLEFARDRLMVNFLWAVGITYEPEFAYCRRILTSVLSLITTIDDVYDVYGTLDELEAFTDAVERWDTKAMDNLPEYMKICFFALHNSVNEIAFTALLEQRVHIIKYLKKGWADLCKAYMLEARWYYSGYSPTLHEYIENAWFSISAPIVLIHAYFLVTNQVTEEALALLEKYPSIIRQSSLLLRLSDDLGTSSDEKERGDVPKSIHCYMNENIGASEEKAREYVKYLISEAWKQLNADRVETSPFSKPFIEAATNLGRTAQFIYQYGDGYGYQHSETTDRVMSLFINPISIDH